MLRSARIALLAGGLALAVSPALAALTPSEQVQIAGFVSGGKLGDAGRVRALVARPDLEASESAAPLAVGFARVPFDNAHERFAEALLFAPGSAPSRSALIAPVVVALLGRAEKLDHDTPAGADELVRIQAFIDRQIAGADASANIRDDARLDAAKALEAWFDRERTWLKPGSAGPVRVQAQAAATLVDLARGVVSRRELVTWLGLAGARAALFEKSGVLLVNGGGVPESRVASIVAQLGVAPGALDGVTLWLVDKATPVGLDARGAIVRAGADAASTAPAPPDKLWPAEVDPPRFDATLAEVAHSVAVRVAAHALDGDAKLREAAKAAAARAREGGAPAYLAPAVPASMIPPAGAPDLALEASPAELVAGALQLVLLDMPRALTIALARARVGHPEPTEQLFLALTALADSAGSDAPSELAVGRGAALDKIDQLTRKDGMVVSFRLGSHRLEVLRAPDGRVTGATVDAAAPKLADFGVYRPVPRPGPWTLAGVRLETLSGAPQVALDDAGRLLVSPAPSSGGFDAIVTGDATPAPDVRATLVPAGEGGGLLIGAHKSRVGYTGIALFISAEPARAVLAHVDDSGRATQLGDAVDLPAPRAGAGYDVRLRVDHGRVVATIGNKHLEATTPVDAGQVGVTVRHDGKLQVWSLAVGGAGHGAKKQ